MSECELKSFIHSTYNTFFFLSFLSSFFPSFCNKEKKCNRRNKKSGKYQQMFISFLQEKEREKKKKRERKRNRGREKEEWMNDPSFFLPSLIFRSVKHALKFLVYDFFLFFLSFSLSSLSFAFSCLEKKKWKMSEE